jgi:D-alanyl-lipoteichoic acid acyltransferase DltB (MBOAT superfamily)
VLYSLQIYGDFSGYSDMAIGTAKLFNIKLMQNFAFPYFSRDIAEFWRRWHMSLTTWFRDYLYIPLGGSRGSKLLSIRNTFIVFLVSGLWHGANWTFIVWGGLHAVFFLPLLIAESNRRHVNPIATWLPSPAEAARILWTFVLATVAWVFFRADSVQAAVAYLRGIVGPSLLSAPQLVSKVLLLQIALMFAIEWWNRGGDHGLSLEGRAVPTPVRWGAYVALSGLVLFGGGATGAFIYFQF